jgi:hypothetical protein
MLNSLGRCFAPHKAKQRGRPWGTKQKTGRALSVSERRGFCFVGTVVPLVDWKPQNVTSNSPQGMVLLELALQVVQVAQLVAFCRTYILVTGHVLHLPKVVVFQPVGDHTGPDLFGVMDLRTDLSDLPEHVMKAVFNVITAIDADKQPFLQLLRIDPLGFS